MCCLFTKDYKCCTDTTCILLTEYFDPCFYKVIPNIIVGTICCWLPVCLRDQTFAGKNEVKHVLYSRSRCIRQVYLHIINKTPKIKIARGFLVI